MESDFSTPPAGLSRNDKKKDYMRSEAKSSERRAESRERSSFFSKSEGGKKIILLIGTLAIALVLTGAGCNSYKTSSTKTSSVATAPNSVTIANLSFSPTTLTVQKGATVTWTNNESTNHTITADDKTFESGNLSKGKTFQFTFKNTGTFSYHCSIHPNMTGKVIVQ